MPPQDLFNTSDIGLKRIVDPILDGAVQGKGRNIQVAAGIVEIPADGDDNWVYQRNFDSSRAINLASMSKQFTGAAIASLEATDPDFGIDDPVGDHLPDWPSYASDVTVKHLLNHTSGLRNYSGRLGRWFSSSPQSVVNWVSDRNRRVRPPGIRFEYCNTGYVVLARIVEVVSGQQMSAFLAQRFFRPLRMRSTFVRARGDQSIPRTMPTYYGRFARAIPLPNDFMPGDGGVYSTVADLGKWARFLAGASPLGPDLPQTMMQDLTLDDGSGTDYGYGLRVDRVENGRDLVKHDGSWNGAKSECNFFPARGDEPAVWFVVLANANSLDPGDLIDRINNTYFNRPFRAPQGP